MVGLGLVEILQPFLQLAVFADLQRRQLRPRRFQPGAELRVATQYPRALDARGEEVIDEHAIAGRPHGLAARLPVGRAEKVLGRHRRPGHQPPVFGMLHHVIEEELRRFLQHRIRPLRQERLVAGELVMLPQVRRDPDAARRVDAPAVAPTRRGEAPGIGDDVADPTARPVHPLRRAPPRHAQRLDQPKQRLVTLGEITGLCRPIVLLRVDVEMEIARPAHIAGQVIVPDALQVRRQRRVLA